MGRLQGADQQGRRAVVPNAENGPRHRRGPPPPASPPAGPLAARAPPGELAVDAARRAVGGHAAAPHASASTLAGAVVQRPCDRVRAGAHRQGGRQPALPARNWHRTGVYRRHSRPDRRQQGSGMRDPIGRRRDDMVVQQLAGADGGRGRMELQDVLDRWHRQHRRHGERRGRRVGDVELRRVRGADPKRRLDVVRHLRIERRQHDQSLHLQHQCQPAAAGDHTGRVAVRPGDAHAQHGRQALTCLRRPRRFRRHEPDRAEHHRPRIAARLPWLRRGHSDLCVAPDQEASVKTNDRDNINLTLIALTCAMLMVLPLVTTFDDLLTSWAMQLGANNPLQGIVPAESRMVVSLLGLVGIHAAASGSHLVVWDASGSMHTLFISWNCIGWQSLILFGVSLVSGLRGTQSLESRLQVICIGVAGTMLLNLVRVAAVAAIAATVGVTPAILFHDYGGTILFVAFLFAFWAFAQRWILDSPPSSQQEMTA
ncbi:MAG: hypothetical protein E6I81_01260 [Chloroflexi bacterium]|nr:MAG: hypothetical protein E6I81_01260 [Chloroflexota bacterium]